MNWTVANTEKKKSESSGSDIDFEYVANQVKTGANKARISVVVDLGMQNAGTMLNDQGETYFNTEEEANDFMERIANDPNLGERSIDENDLEIEEIEKIYKLPFKLINKQWVFMESQDPTSVTYEGSAKKAAKTLKEAITAVENNTKKPAKFKKKELEFLEALEPELMEDVFMINCQLRDSDDAPELAVFADLTGNRVEYVEDEEDSKRQYRVALNPPFKGVVKGTRIAPDKKGAVPSKSALAKLFVAVGLDPAGDLSDNLNAVAGSPLQLEIKKNGDFINVGAKMSVGEDDIVDELDNPPITITFGDDVEALVEKLKKAYLRKDFITKIKGAQNYEGSNIQKALDIIEGGGAEEDALEGTSEAEEAPVEKKAPKAKVKKEKPVEEPVAAEDDDDSFDDDIPFAPFTLMHDNSFIHCV